MSFIYSPVQNPTATALGGRTSASERDATLFPGVDAGAKIAHKIRVSGITYHHAEVATDLQEVLPCYQVTI